MLHLNCTGRLNDDQHANYMCRLCRWVNCCSPSHSTCEMAVSDCVDSFGLLVFEMGVGMPFRPPVFKGPSWVVIPLSAEADHRLDSRRDGGPHSGQPLTGADKFTIHCADGTASKLARPSQICLGARADTAEDEAVCVKHQANILRLRCALPQLKIFFRQSSLLAEMQRTFLR